MTVRPVQKREPALILVPVSHALLRVGRCDRGGPGQIGFMRYFALLVASSFSILGCDGTGSQTFEDEGNLCIRAQPSGGIEVTVDIPTCLSSSCDSVPVETCTLEREGSEIRVRTRVVVESQGGSCTDDCGIPSVSCSLASIEPGEYSVVHGEERFEVTLPSTPPVDEAPVFCEGNPPTTAEASGWVGPG